MSDAPPERRWAARRAPLAMTQNVAHWVYSLTDQIRCSSRSVCSNLAEAWRKRRYESAFISKLSDAEGEASETQVWLEFAVRCKYVKRDEAAILYRTYDSILGTFVGMINHPETWVIGKRWQGDLVKCR